jgi:hypothetical protein
MKHATITAAQRMTVLTRSLIIDVTADGGA